MSISVTRAAALALVASVMTTSIPLAFANDSGRWYLGIGVGTSRLNPDTDGTDFTLEDKNSTATGLYFGWDLSDWLGAEVAYTNLGKAELSDELDVEYAAFSLGGLAYLIGEKDLVGRQKNWSGFLRLGVNGMKNKADVDLQEKNNIAIWFGAGVQWPISRSWGLRAEVNTYDGDAQAAIASLYWRPTATAGQSQTRSSSQVTALPQSATPAESTSKVSAESTNPDSEFSGSSCAVPASNEPLNDQGCAMFSGVQSGIQFEGDTAQLTSVAETELVKLAELLSANPGIVVEIRVHTQFYRVANRARELSRERALAVAQYLVNEGVDVKQLRARAFGSSEPRDSNDTALGRQLNNRVELRVL